MKRSSLIALLSLCTPAFAQGGEQSGEWDIGVDVALEGRVFFADPAFPGQFDRFQPSLTVTPDIRWTSDNGQHQVVIVPFLRVDGQDDERTHTDLREGYYRYVGNDYEVLLGFGKVFWGVTESRHLVDVINQTDAVDDIDEEDKLGQPMVMVTLYRDWGQLDLFYLPYFRERTFPGVEGRLRTPFVVDTDNPIFDGEGFFEDDIEDRFGPSFAARYSHFFGQWDVSLSAFHGLSREPGIAFNPITLLADGPVSASPTYDRITQLGTTLQYTNDEWLWKFEGFVREGHGDTFAAAVGGVEYTFYGVTNGVADLGFLAEYQYDGRDETAPFTAADNDVFLGSRYALNDIQDTSILGGVIVDTNDGSTAGLVEASRRLGENWTAELEARFFTNVDDANLLAAFREDSHLSFRLTRYF